MTIGAALRLQVVALIDPNLDSNVALRCLGLGEAVIDLGPERGKRDRPQVPLLRPRHFGAAEPARELDPDPSGATVHRLLERALHGPAEARPFLKLLRDVLADQLRIDLGPGDF